MTPLASARTPRPIVALRPPTSTLRAKPAPWLRQAIWTIAALGATIGLFIAVAPYL
ncbi:hypothetical protein [Naasia lichenicola]|uniref:hypothetical protein n=1 Tax=Naasia lichenicola TaxID=2565933 RepID=UPI00130DB1C8|nr:hypothetical protein [Naasia lichenicola]